MEEKYIFESKVDSITHLCNLALTRERENNHYVKSIQSVIDNIIQYYNEHRSDIPISNIVMNMYQCVIHRYLNNFDYKSIIKANNSLIKIMSGGLDG